MTLTANGDNSGDTPIGYPSGLSRREFLKRLGVLGGGVVVYFYAGDASSWAQSKEGGSFGAGGPEDFNAFLRIGTDGRVTGFTGKIEMGQGPITSLPQMLAEELDVAFEAVDFVMGDTDLCPWDMGTFGSLTTRVFGVSLRKAAAEAKAALKELAAEKLNCPLDRLATEAGYVYDKHRLNKRIAYGDLAKGKPIERKVSGRVDLTPSKEFAVMGKPFFRKDAAEKVTGKAEFAADIRLPGMLYATVLRPPAHGAKLKHLDLTAVGKLDGITVVREKDFTAILHERPDAAVKAVSRAKAEYDRPKTGVNDKSIFDHLLKAAPSPRTVSEGGKVETGVADATYHFQETYLNSYVAHAPIEPHAALARFEDGRMTIWASTQNPFGVKQAVAGLLKLKPDQIHVIAPFVGGGFGGKTNNTQAMEAAFLAMKTGRPVQVAWTREEEFFLDTFRPAAIVKIRSGIGEAGKITFWDYDVYHAGSRGCEQYYDIPHHRERSYGEWMGQRKPAHPFAVGPWRAPSNNTNTYARELHMNIMAAKSGLDPLSFRLKNLKDHRMVRVLKAVGKAAGWRGLKTPSGRGIGLACGVDAGTYVAVVAEVDVSSDTGKVRASRVICAQDMGTVVNPQGATIQVEGCVTMGLGYALAEEIRFEDGEIFDSNFDTYQIPRFSWVPKIETVLIENNDLPPQGGGEPAIICMGGAMASAVFDATGAKLYQLPMTPERVEKALVAA